MNQKPNIDEIPEIPVSRYQVLAIDSDLKSQPQMIDKSSLQI